MIHDLKTDPKFFELAVQGLKTFEYRKSDRNFKLGDTIRLLEYGGSPAVYTGYKCSFEITHILTKKDFSIVATGYVLLSMRYIT